MSNKVSQTVVPKLRFSEFRDQAGWSCPDLGEISTRITKKVGEASLDTVSITAGQGFFTQVDKFGRDISGQQYKNYIELKKGEFSYNKGNSKTFPQGCIYSLRKFDKVAAPNAFISFRFNRNYIGDFYQGYFDNNFHGRQLARYLTSGARSDGLLNISPDDFFSIVLPTPLEEEQQKIADCISSIDELIATENQKLEALQDYKKGLMQQLFPAEGETLPKLRFPEFLDAPEWQDRPLGEVAENLDSKRVPITSADRKEGSVPYYGATGIIDYVEGYIFEEDLLCISEDGANLKARNYPIAFSISGKTWVNNHAHVLRFEDWFTQKIVESYLNSISLEDYLTGMAQPKLNRAKLDSIPVPLPESDEQKKVADCLSSVDEMIASQSQKIESLVEHKTGLMQQLFPSVDEVMG